MQSPHDATPFTAEELSEAIAWLRGEIILYFAGHDTTSYKALIAATLESLAKENAALKSENAELRAVLGEQEEHDRTICDCGREFLPDSGGRCYNCDL